MFTSRRENFYRKSDEQNVAALKFSAHFGQIISFLDILVLNLYIG